MIKNNDYVFVSFPSKDKAITERICSFLEKEGIRCWASFKDIPGGGNFQSFIPDAIRNSKLVVLIFSSNTAGSGEIRKELALASKQKKVVVPVRIEDIIPGDWLEYEITIWQWFDLFGKFEEEIKELSNLIKSHLNIIENDAREGPAMASPLRSFSQFKGYERSKVVTGALVTIAILGATALYFALHFASTPRISHNITTTPIAVTSVSTINNQVVAELRKKETAGDGGAVVLGCNRLNGYTVFGFDDILKSTQSIFTTQFAIGVPVERIIVIWKPDYGAPVSTVTDWNPMKGQQIREPRYYERDVTCTDVN